MWKHGHVAGGPEGDQRVDAQVEVQHARGDLGDKLAATTWPGTCCPGRFGHRTLVATLAGQVLLIGAHQGHWRRGWPEGGIGFLCNRIGVDGYAHLGDWK